LDTIVVIRKEPEETADETDGMGAQRLDGNPPDRRMPHRGSVFAGSHSRDHRCRSGTHDALAILMALKLAGADG